MFFRPSVTITTITASLASKRELEAVFSVFFNHLPPSPPPSHPNASRGLCFSAFRHDYHYHRLPHVQMRARGGVFRLFQPPATITTPLASKCEPGVVFFRPSVTITTITASLASKHEPEAVFSVFFNHLPPSPPPSRPNVSRGLCFSAFRHDVRLGSCLE